ncbi:MAG: glycosyltransferase family 2 protein [Nitrospiraceae bacterium]|nr:glycosyltransferase family 2 protein [Nitrospiraceae bacterium]
MKISVITVAFNAAGTITGCLNSVKAQGQGVEHIVVDGGSADGTVDIILSRRSQIAQFVSEPDGGIYDAMNKGIRMATGDIIGILNADDVYESRDVTKRVAEVFEDPSHDGCYGDLLYVHRTDANKVFRYWRSGKYTTHSFYLGWMPPHPAFFVRRELYGKYGLFDTGLGTSADYELMLRLFLKHKLRAVYIPSVLVRMRTGGTSNASILNRLRANRMDRKAWKVNGLTPYPFTLVAKPLRKLGQFLARGQHFHQMDTL